MRLTSTSSSYLFASLALTIFVRAATITLPDLISCEPADIRVLAKGNYTIEGRDLSTRKLVFRAHIDQGINRVTWDAVDLPANSTAVVSVLDQVGFSPSETSLVSAEGLVQPNPIGNTTCLARSDKDKKGGATRAQKNMVPTIIGIVLGAFFVLVLLLVAGMMYRRKKEKVQKIENDSVDLNHGYPAGSVPAGGSYMARLVPGLKLQEAKPLPRDYRLEQQQQDYANTRRGTSYYKSPEVGNGKGDAGFELPSYNKGARVSSFYRKDELPNDQSSLYNGRGEYQSQQQQQQQEGGVAGNPFVSQQELPYHQPQQRMYQQSEYDHSQTSFLTKKSSHQ